MTGDDRSATYEIDLKTTKHLDERLDEALEESFPASDPPAVHTDDDPEASLNQKARSQRRHAETR